MQGDANRFIELLRLNYNDALKYCRALCSNRSADDANDVLQQSLLQALEKFDTLKDSDKFRSWLFTIITRAFYTSIRKNFWKRFKPLDKEGSPVNIPDVYSKHDTIETRLVLNSALSRLSSKERAAILLYEIAGFKIEEIKEIQNEKSASAVKSRLSRTREKLKKYILESENRISEKIKNESTNLIEDIENETIKLSTEYNRGK